MRKVIAFALLSLLITGFIWSNSLMSVEQSGEQSSVVAETIQPVIDPNEKVEKPKFHDFIRKAAHVIEFLALGLSVVGFALSLGKYLGKNFVSMPILIVLSVAVTDEFIQHFTKRGSLVKDVVLDFAGGIAGLCLGWLLYFIVARVKRRRHSHEMC